MYEFCGVVMYDKKDFEWFVKQGREMAVKLTEIQELFSFHEKVHLYMFDTVPQLAGVLEIDIPEWTKGISYDHCICLIRKSGWREGKEEPMTALLLHEYVHAAVLSVFRTHCPTWLNEGLAVLLSGQIEYMDAEPCVEEHSIYDGDYEDSAFYRQAALTVRRLVDRYGKKELIQRARMCTNFRDDPVLGEEAVRTILAERKEVV